MLFHTVVDGQRRNVKVPDGATFAMLADGLDLNPRSLYDKNGVQLLPSLLVEAEARESNTTADQPYVLNLRAGAVATCCACAAADTRKRAHIAAAPVTDPEGVDPILI
jgi:hypothetical protein